MMVEEAKTAKKKENDFKNDFKKNLKRIPKSFLIQPTLVGLLFFLLLLLFFFCATNHNGAAHHHETEWVPSR